MKIPFENSLLVQLVVHQALGLFNAINNRLKKIRHKSIKTPIIQQDNEAILALEENNLVVEDIQIGNEEHLNEDLKGQNISDSVDDIQEEIIEEQNVIIANLLKSSASRPSKDLNEDYHSSFYNEFLNFSGIIVADGLGSHQYCNIGSKEVVEFVKQRIENVNSFDDLDMAVIFKDTKDHLIKFAKEYLGADFESIDKNKAFGTTLIIVLENKSVFKIAYVGNGAIWHIRGNFNRFESLQANQLLTYNAINYLNPHSLMFEGREILYKLISISEDYYEAEPTILEINTDTEFGDIIMICTDGIYSYDQVKMGSKNGYVWVRDEKINLFFSELSSFLQKNVEDINEEFLELFLNEYLKNTKIEDDATIAIILNKQVLEFQKKLKYANLEGK